MSNCSIKLISYGVNSDLVVAFVGSFFSHYMFSFGMLVEGFCVVLFPLWKPSVAQPTLTPNGSCLVSHLNTKRVESPFFLQKLLTVVGPPLPASGSGSQQACNFSPVHSFVFLFHTDINIVFKHGCVFSFLLLCFTIIGMFLKEGSKYVPTTLSWWSWLSYGLFHYVINPY